MRTSWTELMVWRRGLLGVAYRRASAARRLVSANFDNASRILDFGSVRVFGQDGQETARTEHRASPRPYRA